MLPLLACSAGVYLGVRFNILVLLPFSALGAGAFLCSSWASGESFGDSASVALFLLISVQAGYMIGLTLRGACEQMLARLNIDQSTRI